MKKNNINSTFFTIAWLLIMVVSLTGATFAWMSVRSSGAVTASSTVNTATLGTVTFANGTTATASGENVYPGWTSTPITFKITGANTAETLNYSVTATVTGSTVLANALTYSMSCTKTGNGTCATTVSKAPTATATYSGTLGSGNDVHTYTVNMGLPETGTDQNSLQGLNYSVSFSVALTSSAVKYTQSGSTRTIYNQ